MKKILFIPATISLILIATSSWSTNYYASTTGSAGNAGTLASPWSILRALNDHNTYSGYTLPGPGDTLWIRGGTYSLGSASEWCQPQILGTAGNPLIIRNYNNERVTFSCEGGFGAGSSHYTWWWGIEFTGTSSQNLNQAGASGVQTSGMYQRWINCIVHDATGAGFADWGDAPGNHITGCLVYYNGRVNAYDTKTAHNYGIYAQTHFTTSSPPYGYDPAGTVKSKYYRDNIWWNNFGQFQLHLYTSGDASSGDAAYAAVDSFFISRNVIFSYSQTPTLINDWGATDRGIRGLTVDSCMWWSSTNMGYLQDLLKQGEMAPQGATIRGNYFMRGRVAWVTGKGTGTITGNTFYGRWPAINNGDTPLGSSELPGNTFYCSGDESPPSPTGTKTFLYQNQYEPRRANLIIYNFNQYNSVKVKMTPIYANGDTVQLRDVQNYWTIATTQIVANDSIAVPCNLTAISTPLSVPTGGIPDVYPQHSDSRFNAFVVYKIGWGTPEGQKTAVDNDAHLPREYSLHQNYPNPFNPDTKIEFGLPTTAHVTLEVFDALGRKVAILESSTLGAGFYTRRWSAAGFPSGVYLYRMRAGNFTEVKKMLLAK